MDDLKSVTAAVKCILEQYKQARNSDGILYMKVMEYYEEKLGINLQYLPTRTFLAEMYGKAIPGFETVRRARQKVQAKHPELAACDRVEVARWQNEKVFRAFARG